MQLYNGDCLEIMKDIPDKSIDMILCDLPYGTTQNKWDSVIPFNKLWLQYDRIIKNNAAIVLFSQGIFTAKLICSKEDLFKYKIIWIKSKATGFLNAKKQPLRKHEEICVFYKNQPVFNPQFTNGEKYNRGLVRSFEKGTYGSYKEHSSKSDGKRYPTDICFYQDIDDFIYHKTAESEGKVYHPTQKPIGLLEYLIKTFTNEHALVLDNCMGSGSTGVAAVNTNRNFIGIEKDLKYFEIAKERLYQAQKDKEYSLF